jgi:hypothetical protein
MTTCNRLLVLKYKLALLVKKYPLDDRKLQKIFHFLFLHLFHSNTHNNNANEVTKNSIAIHKVLKTLHLGEGAENNSRVLGQPGKRKTIFSDFDGADR